MPQTKETSKMVGKTLKSKADNKKLIPRLPRSIAYKYEIFKSLDLLAVIN